jgi:hypothetical protein
MNDIQLFAWTKALELEQINNSKINASIVRTKDPTIDALEQSVLSKLAQFSVENKPTPTFKNHLPSNNITLSPEEAMKELAEMESKGLI